MKKGWLSLLLKLILKFKRMFFFLNGIKKMEEDFFLLSGSVTIWDKGRELDRAF